MGPRAKYCTMLRVPLLPLQERQSQLGPEETPPALSRAPCSSTAAQRMSQSAGHRQEPWGQRAEQPCGPTSPTRAAAEAGAAPRGRDAETRGPRPLPAHREGDLAQLGHPLLALLLLGRQEVAAAAGLQAEGGGAGPGAALGGRGGDAGAVRQAHHRLVQAPRTQPPGWTRRVFAIEELQASDAVLAGREQREPAPLPPLQGTESARDAPSRPVAERGRHPPWPCGRLYRAIGGPHRSAAPAERSPRLDPRPGNRPTPAPSHPTARPRAEPTLAPNLLLCCTNIGPSLAGGSIPRRRSQRFRRRSRAERRDGAGRGAHVSGTRGGARGAERVESGERAGAWVSGERERDRERESERVRVSARVRACVCARECPGALSLSPH